MIVEESVIKSYLDQSAALHSHLCPRQVLGVRMALAGASELDIAIPRADRRLLVIVETDGCFADSIQVVTGASVGARTLRVVDYGKVAVTLIDVGAQRAVRVAPRPEARQNACARLPAERRYFAMLQAYRWMDEDELLVVQDVALRQPVSALLGRAGLRVNCARCGEEILNGREVRRGGETLCQSCAGEGYYRVA